MSYELRAVSVDKLYLIVNSLYDLVSVVILTGGTKKINLQALPFIMLTAERLKQPLIKTCGS